MRKQRETLCLLFSICFYDVLSLQVATTKAASTPEKPNVLMFLVDIEQVNDNEYSWFEGSASPYLNELAHGGIMFSSHTAASRNSLLTGQVKPILDQRTKQFLPSKLKSIGYQTIGIGDWHLGLKNPQYLPIRKGFQEYFHIMHNDNHELSGSLAMQAGRVVQGRKTEDEILVKLWDSVDFEQSSSSEQETSMDIYTKKAIESLNNVDHPFFLYLSFQHSPDQVPSRFVDGSIDNGCHDHQSRSFYGMMSHIDHSVSSLVSHLKSSKQWEHTLFAFVLNLGPGSTNRCQPAFLSGGFLKTSLVSQGTSPFRSSALLHLSDLHPTILTAISAYDETTLEDEPSAHGIDHWSFLLAGGKESLRSEAFDHLEEASEGDTLQDHQFCFPFDTRTDVGPLSLSSRGTASPSPQKHERTLTLTSYEVLSQLYSDTGGSNWTTSTNWMSGTPCPSGAWYGVTCSGSEVISLSVANNNLVGSLPSEIGQLTSLVSTLKLNGNSLIGTIPSQIGLLSLLSSNLYLNSNDFTGFIPSQIGQLTAMQSFFWFNSNSLSGTVPSELGRMTSMVTRFILYSNDLSGSLPSQLGLLSLMTSYMYIYVNDFSGSLPSQLGQMTSMEKQWNVRTNSFFGTLPSQLGRLSLMTADFYLRVNDFTGSFPSQLGQLTGLTEDVEWDTNSFCSDVPSQVAFLSSQVTSGWDTTGNSFGTLCCVALPSTYTCAPTSNPTPVPTIVPTPFTDSPTIVPTETTDSPTPSPTISPTVQCTSGTYLDGLSCENCAIGSYSSFDGAPFPTSCTPCQSGKYNTASGESSCIECATGKLSSADRTFCKDCEAGEYNFNNTECVSCEYGKYAPQALTDSCLTCTAGSNTNNASKATTCTACDAGTYSNASSVDCLSCSRGKYSPSGSSKCLDCEAGFISPEVGASTCTSCSAGKYTSIQGSYNCTVCAKGKYQGSTGQSECIDCDAGKYIDTSKASTCTSCPIGYDSESGASECDLAQEGYFLSYPDSNSEICPNHAICYGINQVPVPVKGYWIDHSSHKYSSEIYKCSRETCRSNSHNSSCWDLNEFVNDSATCDFDELQCTEGAGGPFCGSCLSGYVYQGISNSCEKCESAQGTSYFAFGIVLLCFVMIFVYFQSGDYFEIKQWSPIKFLLHLDTGCLKVLWVTYQIVVSSSFTIGIEFPSPFSNMLGMLSIFSFDFLALECFNRDDDAYYITVYLWCTLPLIAALLIILGGLFRIGVQSYILSSSQTCKEDIVNQHFWLLLFLSYLVLPPVSNKQLQIFDCTTLASGESFLRSDSAIDCNGDSYLEFQAIILMFTAIYQLIPIIWFVVLNNKKRALNPDTSNHDADLALYVRDNNSDLTSLRFLFIDYKCSKWWFEIADMYRRIIFIGVVPLVSPRPTTRASFGCILAILSVAYFREEQPYRVEFTNVVAHIAQFVILVTFYGALTIETESMINFGLKGVSLGVFLLTLNLVILVLTFFFAWTCFKHQRNHEHRKQSQAAITEDARGFSETKFETTFHAIWSHLIPASHALVFHYTSRELAVSGRKSGIASQRRFEGVPLSLRQPHGTTDNDFDVFQLIEDGADKEEQNVISKQDRQRFPHEEVLVLSLPKQFLERLTGFEDDPGLCMISARVLNAMLPTSFTAVMASQPWLDGVVLLPPQCILRSFMILDVEEKPKVSTQLNKRFSMKADYEVNLSRKSYFHEIDTLPGLLSLDSIEAYVKVMESIRHSASEQRLVPLYHYTSPEAARLILKGGLRMSTQGQGDGGVYVSTQGPASYGLGTDDYEINIIKDCFGVERIDEYEGKDKLCVIIVYGCEPSVLQQAPGGRDHAKMFTKSTFKGFSLEHHDGNFFLRPDRILGAFRVFDHCRPVLDQSGIKELEKEQQREKLGLDGIDIAFQEHASNITRVDAVLSDIWAYLTKLEVHDEEEEASSCRRLDEQGSIDVELTPVQGVPI